MGGSNQKGRIEYPFTFNSNCAASLNGWDVDGKGGVFANGLPVATFEKNKMKLVKIILAILAGLWLLANIISYFSPPLVGEGPPMHIGEEDDIYIDINDDGRFYRWNEEDRVWIKTRHTNTSQRIHEEKMKEFEKGVEQSSCSGNGDASCEGAVMAHINGIQGKEVNFINYIGDGRFSVNIIDVSNGGLAVGGSYSKNVRTDCNCTIVGF